MVSKGSKNHMSQTPDDIIHELGGCGRFQLRIAIVVHLMKTIVCWCSMSMVFVSATPDWWCIDDVSNDNLNETTDNVSSAYKACHRSNGSTCATIEFSTEMRTIVSEVRMVVHAIQGLYF